MSDFLEQLAKFTPDSSGLDREALLFRAGQESIRRQRFWPALACALAVTQAATLAFLLVRGTTLMPDGPRSNPIADNGHPDAPLPPDSRPAWDDLKIVPDAPQAVANLIPQEPPLNVLAFDRVWQERSRRSNSTIP
jgi:hypothetical protein